MKTIKTRIMAIALVCIMLLSIMPLSAFASDALTIAVENKTCAPGEEVSVKINLSSKPGIASLKLKVAYDSTVLTLNSVEYNTEMGGQTVRPQKLSSPVTLTWVSAFAEFSSDCVFATLNFTVAEAVEPNTVADITISYNPDDIYNMNEDNVDCNIETGSVTVITCVPGDINGDGTFNNKDITRMFQYLAGWDVVVNEIALDTNGDKSVNNKDLTRLFQYAADWDVEIFIGSESVKRCSHQLETIPYNAATCTSTGNQPYWHCVLCDKYYSDATASTETSLEAMVIPTTHTFSDKWVSDAIHHWHPASCEHTTEISEKEAHTLNSDNVCSVCKYDAAVYLETPTGITITNDKIFWEEVPNAETYTIVANNNYKITGFSGTACPITYLTLKVGDTYERISEPGKINIKIMAEAVDGYKASKWSEVYSDYYYIPDSQDQDAIKAASDYGLGQPYNFVLDENLNISKAGNLADVLNVSKLLTIASYGTKTNNRGYTKYYNYSSIDEYVSKNENTLKVDFGLEIPVIGGLNAQFNAETSSQYKNYAYNEVYVAEVGVTAADHRIEGLDIGEYGQENEALIACMSPSFLADITGKTTNNLSDEELAEIIFNKYGTHVILGVTTGAAYRAQYVVSTNKEEIAQNARAAYKVGTDLNYKQMVKLSLGIEGEEVSSSDMKTEDTEARLFVEWYGSTSGGTVNVNNIDSAIESFCNNITPVSVRLATSGNNQSPSAVALSDLIRTVSPELADAFEEYVNNAADESYEALYGKYNTALNQLVKSPEVIEGKNVLTIDLSSYQKVGSLESAYSPSLLAGVLELYPVMYTKRIDKIVIRGAFDEADKQNLIDSFTLALPEEWNGKTVEIVIENLGVAATSEHGLIDLSAITNTNGITITYKGINVIKQTNGKYLCHAGNQAFAFDLKEDESIKFDDVHIKNDILLPVAEKENYLFAGWEDGNGTIVTNDQGKVYDNVEFDTSLPVLYATWKPGTSRITLSEEGATQSGTTQFWQMYGIGFVVNGYPQTLQDAIENSVSKITIPVKTGYVFGGYFSECPENNATINATEKGTKYIDADGNFIVSNMEFTKNITLYAKWTPAQYTVVYDSNGGNGAIDSTSHIYDVLVKLPENTFVKSGTSFAGWNTEKDGSGTSFADKQDVMNLTTTDGDTVTLYAQWTNNIVVTLNAMGAENSYRSNLYMTPDKDAVYGEPDCINTISNVSIPAKTGYIFKGYYTLDNNNTKAYHIDKTGVVQESLKSLQGESILLHADWTPITYTVAYQGGGATNGSTTSSTHTYDKVEALTANGFTRQYTVTYNYNGNGSANTTATTAYNFAGWMAENGLVYANNASALNLKSTQGATTTMTARWTATSVTLPTPTRTNYTFAGWYNSSNTRVGGGGDSYTPTANVELHAKWKATVTLDANGGSVSTKSIEIFSDGTYSGLNNIKPARANYDFVGWYYGDQKVTDGMKIVTDGHHTLTAKWVKIYEVWESGARTVHITEGSYQREGVSAYFDLPLLKEMGYTKIKVTVRFSADVVYSCYQRVIVSSATKELYGNDFDISEDGWQTVNFSFTHTLDNFNETGQFWIKWECPDSNWRDEWRLGSATITFTALK